MINKFKQNLTLEQKSDNTIKSYIKRIKPYLDYCDNKPSQKTLDEFILKKVEDGLSSLSINSFSTAMQSFCKHLNIELDLPKQKGRKNKVTPYWTEDQLNADILPMLSLIFPDGEKEKHLLMFMFYTGLRPTEICNLKTCHIDFEKRNIIVKNGKGDKDRIIPFLNDWIEDFLKSRCGDKIFNICYDTLRKKFQKIKKELKLDYEVTPYIMRKSFAKYLLSKGLDVTYIQRLLGHEDIKTTMIYVQPDDNMVKEAINKLSI